MKEALKIYEEALGYDPGAEYRNAPNTELAFQSVEKMMSESMSIVSGTARDAARVYDAFTRLQDHLGRISEAFDEQGDSVAAKELANNQNDMAKRIKELRNRMNDCLSAFENVATMAGTRIKYV